MLLSARGLRPAVGPNNRLYRLYGLAGLFLCLKKKFHLRANAQLESGVRTTRKQSFEHRRVAGKANLPARQVERGGGGRQATSSQRSLPNLQNSSWFHVGRNYSLSVRNTSSLLLTGLHKAKDKEADATDLLLRGGRGTKAKRPSLLCLFLWKGVRLLLRRGSEPKMLTCEENAGLHSVAKTANR